ncbi:ATP-binding cassette domain-containing protein [Microaerobacter geothermalis]|uniref:ABC transporter ATP-binding protein n=1 Tax=Microaerobacter geothermalis TaxID=674972 RepID=UPI001EFF2E8E|nr:ABC transporter transmembrane domain-containing protein [Microaerobacter geothermalis]MCF6095220.1 ATP-binding cassette domain-containing protein [Microaerobacter geothermalis]
MNAFKKLGWFFREQWKKYTLGIILLVVIDLMVLIPPKLIGEVIDFIRSGTLTSESLNQTVLLIMFIAVMLYVLRYYWRYFLFGGSLLLEKTLRSKLFHYLTKMTPSFYHRSRTGDLMALATNDINAIEMTAGLGVLTLVDSIVMTLITFVTMVTVISWKLTLAALIPMPFLAWATSFYGRLLHKRFFDAQEAFGRMNDHVQESISGVRVIRSFVQEKADIHAFEKVSSDVLDKNIRVSRIDALFEPTISTIISSSFLIALAYGAFLVFNSEISLGELVSFNLYLGLLIWPMFAFGWLFNIVQRGNASLDRLENLFQQKPDVEEKENSISIAVPESIEMRDFTFFYPGSQSPAIKHISFQLERGQTLGVVGKTGSGKSTLLKQLLYLFPIEENKIFINNVPLEKISLSALRGWVGYVPQEHLLFSKTIQENITFGKPDATFEELVHILNVASLIKDIEQFPEGLDTLIGEKGVMLSGGQKQRIAIARALLTNPEILILDDSLSAVDAKTEERILENIRKERRGKTTIIAAHRLSAIHHADLILVLDQGEMIEKGTHDSLMATQGWYSEQFRRQQLEESLNMTDHEHDDKGAER